MPQIGRRGDLDQEAIFARVLGEIRPKHLDGHLTVVLAVGGEEHGGHATLAQLPQDGIAATERGFEAFEKIGHTGKMCREMGWR